MPTCGAAMLGPRAGIHLQEEVEARRDVLVCTSEVLQHDMEVTGPITAVLFLRISAPSTDFTVKLVDAYPGRRTYNVCEGIFRRNYENGENSPHRPTEISIDLWPTSTLFR